MKRKMIFLGFVIFTLMFSGCRSSKEPELDSQPVVSTLSVSGTGYASAIPDIVDIQLGVDIVDSDPVEVVNQSTAKMNAVLSVLDDIQISTTDIQTVYYGMWVDPVYDQDGQLTGEKNYHVSNQVNVRLRDMSQIGNLIEKVTDAGATSIMGINFGVADTRELELAALDNAIANVLEKAQRIANEMGLSLGEIVSINEGGYYSPAPYYGDKGSLGGGGAVPISQGQFSITASVQVVYELLPFAQQFSSINSE